MSLQPRLPQLHRPASGRRSAALAALLSVAALIGCGDSRSGEEIEVGEAGRSGAGAYPEKPPLLGAVPPFALTNENGFTIDNDRLAGRVWVASFIFTRCPAICPRLTVAFAKLQETFKSDPDFEAGRLVSFTVDPDYDTPEVLERYARNFGADRRIWTFLTGERAAIWTLSKDGFKLAVSDTPDGDVVIAHSRHFVLVDRLGRIRGYYDGLDEEAGLLLKRDFILVSNDPGWPADSG